MSLPSEDPYASPNPSVELDRLAKKYMDEHKGIKYPDAAQAVLADKANAVLAEAYRNIGRRSVRH